MAILQYTWRPTVAYARRRRAWMLTVPVLLVTTLAAPQASWAVGTAMFSTVPYSTGEKPQSKIWYHDGSYWAVLQGPDGVAIYQKQASTWVRGTYPNAVLVSSGQADVKWSGTSLFVLVYSGTPRLFEYSYNASQRIWVLASGFPVNLPNPSNSETMVLEQDSTGRLWACVEGGGNINVYYSTSADHRTWTSSPIVLQTGVNADDICSIIAFGGSKVGVFWSDQNRDEFGFRIHNDSDSPSTWQSEEVVYPGGGHADDHINLAFDSSGRVYAITKDDNDAMAVHRRSTSGSWTTKTDVVGNSATRGIIMVAEADSKVYILYTRWGVSPERIEYRVADINTLTFGGTTTFISSSSDMNNVTGTKQLLPAGNLIAVAEDGSQCLYNSFGTPPGGSTDPTPPGPPQNLAATLGSDLTSIDLTWSPPSSGTIAGYNVYRSLDGAAAQKLNGSLVTPTSYTDHAPAEGNLCYTVTAVSPDPLEGPASSADCLDYAPPPPPPSAPLGVTAALQGTTPESVQITWQPPTTGVPVGYEVRRSDGGSAYVKIHAGLVAGTTYVDSNPYPGELCYTVTALDALDRAGPASSPDCVDFVPAVPSAPLALTIATAPLAYGPATGAGAWTFDEGSGQIASDATGNGHDGQLGSSSGSDSADPTWTDGMSGSALLFDGSNDRVAVPHDAGLNCTAGFTVEAWVHRDATGTTHTILSKGDSNERNFQVRIDSSDRVDFLWETSGGSNHGTTSGALSWSGWHHVACVYDQTGGEDRIYVDGTLVDSSSDSGTPTTNTAELYIGARVSSGSLKDWFEGTIDLVRVAPFVLYDQDFTPPTFLGNGVPLPRFQLAWQAPTNAPWLAGYHVYRQVDEWPAQQLTTAPIPDASYVDVGPPAGSLRYFVTAVDVLNQEGPASPVASCPNLIEDFTKSGEQSPATLALEVASLAAGRGGEIRYTLPQTANVRLALYDVRGRLVAVLATGDQAAGSHVLSMPFTGSRSERLASGTYFLSLTADGAHISKKLTLVR